MDLRQLNLSEMLHLYPTIGWKSVLIPILHNNVPMILELGNTSNTKIWSYISDSALVNHMYCQNRRLNPPLARF